MWKSSYRAEIWLRLQISKELWRKEKNIITERSYLILLAEVHTEDFWVALRPFHPMKRCPCGNGLLWATVLDTEESSVRQQRTSDRQKDVWFRLRFRSLTVTKQ